MLTSIVLGGGDTGSDCVGTALRQGAKSVTSVELLDAVTEPAGHAAADHDQISGHPCIGFRHEGEPVMDLANSQHDGRQ